MDEHLRLTSISRFHSETWLAFNYQLIEVEKTRKGSLRRKYRHLFTLLPLQGESENWLRVSTKVFRGNRPDVK